MATQSQIQSRTEARNDIVEILGDTVLHALGLKESLIDERQALEKQDMEAIDAAVDCKSSCVEKLRLLDQERDRVCRSFGFASGPDQLQQLIEWCDEGELIDNRWNHLMVVAAESSAMNMTNGAIIRLRQQQFESSLSVLRGVTPGSDTYGRNGAESGDYSRRSLAQA